VPDYYVAPTDPVTGQVIGVSHEVNQDADIVEMEADIVALEATVASLQPAPAPSTTRTWLSGAADDGLAATRSAWQTSFGFYPQVWNTFNDFETDWASRASNIGGNCGKCLPASSTGATVNVLTIGLILSSTTNGQAMNNAGLAAAASGSDTAFTPGWTSIGQAIANAGHNAKSTVLRIGHEMNGNWYPWSTNGDTTAMANYVTAWQKAVTAVRAVCPLVRFDMCYNSGNLGVASSASAIITGHYAGDSYVDVIGLDYYDFQEAHTAATYTSNQGGLGFAQLAAFANTHGKKFALNEWGVNGDNDPNASTRDSPFYISTTFTTLQALQSQYPGIVDHDAYFNVNGNNAKFAVNPLSAAQYNTSFGNGAGTGTVPGGTATPAGAGTVTGVSYVPGRTSVVANWTGATGSPDSYNIYRNYAYLTTVGASVRTFTHGSGTPAANTALAASTAITLGISAAISGTNGPETDTSVTTTA